MSLDLIDPSQFSSRVHARLVFVPARAAQLLGSHAGSQTHDESFPQPEHQGVAVMARLSHLLL